MTNSRKNAQLVPGQKRTPLPRLPKQRSHAMADVLFAFSESPEKAEALHEKLLREQWKSGKVGLLLAAVKSGSLSRPVRSVLADVITGKLKRHNHRPPNPNTELKRMHRALRVLELEGSGWTKREAAVER